MIPGKTTGFRCFATGPFDGQIVEAVVTRSDTDGTVLAVGGCPRKEKARPALHPLPGVRGGGPEERGPWMIRT